MNLINDKTMITSDASEVKAPIEISVVIPIYNGSEYLTDAIQSILNQTFKDFECIIVCEYGSEEECMAILEHYAEIDSRIILIQNEERLGIAASLNRGFHSSKGKYIARMDGDDISSPRRLEIQKLYMDYYQDIDILGIRHRVIGSDNWLVDYPANPDQIACDLLFMSPLRHPTIMLRKSAVDKYNLYYDESLSGVEDYELYIRASKHVRISNVLEDSLFYHRRTNQNLSLIHRDRDDELQTKILKDFYNDILDMQMDDEDIMRLSTVTFLKNCTDVNNELRLLNSLLIHVEETNGGILIEKNGVEQHPFPEKHLREAIFHRWMRARYNLSNYYSGHIPQKILDTWRKGVYYQPWMN